MSSTVKDISQVLRELSIELTDQEVATELDGAYARLRKEARVPGFRRGKAPRSVLKNMFGPAVLDEVRGSLISKGLIDAIREHDLEPMAEPEVDAGPLEANKPFTFTAKMEIRPRLEAISTDGIEIDRYKIVVADDQIDAELARLRETHAEVYDLDEARPAADGDAVKFTVKKWEEGEWKDAPWSEQDAVVGGDNVPEKMSEALRGASLGEEKVVDFGSEEELESERARYMINMTSIQGRRLPELDDDFAKDLGEYDTLAELKAQIESTIRASLEQQEDDRLKMKLFDSLREKNPMELPPSIVEQQADMMRARLRSSFAMYGQELDDEKMKEIDEGAEDTAHDTIHQQFLVFETARLENIEVGDDDIEQALAETAEKNGVPLPRLKAELADERRRDDYRVGLLEKKVFDLLLDRVKLNDVDAPVSEPDAEK